MSEIIMIHEVNNKVLETVETLGRDSIITFDDGLYTQFQYREHFVFFKRVIFFVNPSIICESVVNQSDEYIQCHNAHKKAFKGCFENYMTLEQIQRISKESMYNFEIGSHSYNHKYFKDSKSLIKDIQDSLDFFESHNIPIKSFCFPYNQDSKNPHFIHAVKLKFKDLDIFGSNRIPIESKFKS